MGVCDVSDDKLERHEIISCTKRFPVLKVDFVLSLGHLVVRSFDL